MQKWEYCSLVTSSKAGYLTYYQPSGNITSRVEDYSTQLAELGRQGWELVSVAAFRTNTGFYLKRPLP